MSAAGLHPGEGVGHGISPAIVVDSQAHVRPDVQAVTREFTVPRSPLCLLTDIIPRRGGWPLPEPRDRTRLLRLRSPE